MYIRIGLVVLAISVAMHLLFGASETTHAEDVKSRAVVTGYFECDVKFDDWGDELTLEQCVIDDVEFSTD